MKKPILSFLEISYIEFYVEEKRSIISLNFVSMQIDVHVLLLLQK